MNKRYMVLLLILIVIINSTCNQHNKEISDEGFIAFSLNEAQNILKKNVSPIDSNVFSLGGITRLAGMVIDRSNKDIILIGKYSDNLPQARLDDLVVALKARLLYNELPSVSIDPVENTETDNLLEVRFGGHIEHTSFGNEFLLSDILLKKYSLELVKQVKGVSSYCELFLEKELNSLKNQGITIEEVYWVNSDSMDYYKGVGVDAKGSSQSRFWFNYKDPFRIRIRNDVFSIMSLEIIVEEEIIDIRKENRDIGDSFSAQSEFVKLFSDNYYRICEKHPTLKRLKLLFDMTALAEGLKNTNDIPNISYLLNEYQVKKVDTKKEFELIKKNAIVKRSDGKTNLLQLSGGIETSVEMEWLNAGDVSVLKKIVLDSRPSNTSLYWKLPLDQWKMPNGEGIISKSNSKNDEQGIGCTVKVGIVEINPENRNDKVFQGFAPIMQVEPLKGGVDMKMVIDSSSFRRGGNELEILRDQILNNDN